MGLIRGWLLVIASVLFFLSLLVTGSFLTLTNSLDYSNIQDDLAPIVSEVVNNSGGFQESYQFILNYCVGGENVSYSSQILGKIQIPCDVLNNGVDATVAYYSLTESKLENSKNVETFRKNLNLNYLRLVEFCIPHENIFLNSSEDSSVSNISCETVLEGPEAIIEEQVGEKIEDIYYKDYNCSFFECIKSEPLALVSEKTHDYFQGKFRSMIFLNLILFGVLFLLVEVRSNAFILSGILFVVSALPFSKLEWIIGIFAKIELLKFFTFMFSESFSVFIKFLIFGLVLIGIGFVWKSFSIGFKINSFFEKFRKSKPVVVEKSVKKQVQ